MRSTRRVLGVLAVAAAGALSAATANAGGNGGVFYPTCQPAVVRHAVHPPAVVMPAAVGIQLFDVRLVDAGFPEKLLGPRFRVSFRNLGPAVTVPFDVVLAAGINDQFVAELPQLRQRVSAMAPGQIISVDLRLPLEVMSMAHPAQGAPEPFTTLFVLVAEQQDLLGNVKLKQLVALPRANILPVDLDILPPADNSIPSGAVISLAGEGFGLQPGQVRMRLGGLELLGQIVNWGPLGIQVKLPELALAAPALGELLVIRHDGQHAPVLPIKVLPVQPVVVAEAVAVAQPAVAGAAVPAGAAAVAALPAGPAAVAAGPAAAGPIGSAVPAGASAVPAGVPTGAAPAAPPAAAAPQGPPAVAAPVDPAIVNGPAPPAPAAGPAPGVQPPAGRPQPGNVAQPPLGAVPPGAFGNAPMQPSAPINGLPPAGPQDPSSGNPQHSPLSGPPALGQFPAAQALGGAGLLARPGSQQ
jgi:hypothetical protein